MSAELVLANLTKSSGAICAGAAYVNVHSSRLLVGEIHSQMDDNSGYDASINQRAHSMKLHLVVL
jgi:hypothetical protein